MSAARSVGQASGAVGLFEQAHGGTLFLDEVGELSAANQSRLLRAVEAKAFRRVGGEKEIVIDLRIVCATNRALQTAGESGFRPDSVLSARDVRGVAAAVARAHGGH
jgi:transcriptional regulator with PAS, ATPase and Fis domain